MGVLVEKPDIKAFWAAPEISDAYKKFERKEAAKLIKEVGHVFAKHRMHEDFGLVLVHRHFDMTEKEVLVETLTDDKSMCVAIPWLVKESVATPNEPQVWDSYTLKEKEFVFPRSWSFLNDGRSKAFEYLASNEALPPPPQEFVQDLFQALKSLGLETMMGIGRVRKVPSKYSWEVTPKGIRANVTNLAKRPDDLCDDCMIVVGWAFNEQGQIRDGDWCIFNCCGNCCGTCTR